MYASRSGTALGSGKKRNLRSAESLSRSVVHGSSQTISTSAESTPRNIVVLPILFEGEVKAVMELSSLDRFNPTHQAFLDQLTESIGIVLNTIEANTLTEDLLKQSQSLATELQSRQQELQQEKTGKRVLHQPGKPGQLSRELRALRKPQPRRMFQVPTRLRVSIR